MSVRCMNVYVCLVGRSTRQRKLKTKKKKHNYFINRKMTTVIIRDQLTRIVSMLMRLCYAMQHL